MFNYFLVSANKKGYKDANELGKLFTFVNLVSLALGALILCLALFVPTQLWRYLEYIFCLIPSLAGMLAASKLLYRYSLAERNDLG